MSGPGSTATTAEPKPAEAAAPPQSQLLLVAFPDEAKLDQAIGAIAIRQPPVGQVTVYRLAVLAKGADGRITVQDVAEEGHGTVGAGALLGGLTGLAGGPLGVAIGVGAGALLGWSAEIVNEDAVIKFADEQLSALPFGRRTLLAEVAADAVPAFRALMAANGGEARRKAGYP